MMPILEPFGLEIEIFYLRFISRFFAHELFLFFSYLKRKRGNSIFKNSLMKIQL